MREVMLIREKNIKVKAVIENRTVSIVRILRDVNGRTDSIDTFTLPKKALLKLANVMYK